MTEFSINVAEVKKYIKGLIETLGKIFVWYVTMSERMWTNI